MSALREVTVADLIERLSALPQHYHVSPIVNGTAGAGIGTWLAYIEDVREVVVLFGEKPIGTPPTVPDEWLTEDGACATCHGTGRVGWAPGQQRHTEDDQQPCPDCTRDGA